MTEWGACFLLLVAPAPGDQGVAVERQPAARVHHRHRPVHPEAGWHRALETIIIIMVIMSKSSPLSYPRHAWRLTVTPGTPCPASGAGGRWPGGRTRWWWSTERWTRSGGPGPAISAIIHGELRTRHSPGQEDTRAGARENLHSLKKIWWEWWW